jgi:hypothetical protein
VVQVIAVLVVEVVFQLPHCPRHPEYHALQIPEQVIAPSLAEERVVSQVMEDHEYLGVVPGPQQTHSSFQQQ